MNRRLASALAAVALVLAVTLGVLALDVAGWRGTVAADDVAFQAGRGADWRVSERAPGGLARTLLGIDDDLAYRNAVRNFTLARSSGADPQRTVALRAVTQAQLERLVATDRDPSRRARAANLLGIVDVVASSDGVELTQQEALLRAAVASFQTAVRLDPGNESAKVNLELTLRRAQALSLPLSSPGGKVPNPGRTGGLGRAGSGY